MFRLIKQVFIALLSFVKSLASIANVSNFTACIPLNNPSCMTRPTVIDLNTNEHNQGLRYYPFIVILNRCY